MIFPCHLHNLLASVLWGVTQAFLSFAVFANKHIDISTDIEPEIKFFVCGSVCYHGIKEKEDTLKL